MKVTIINGEIAVELAQIPNFTIPALCRDGKLYVKLVAWLQTKHNMKWIQSAYLGSTSDGYISFIIQYKEGAKLLTEHLEVFKQYGELQYIKSTPLYDTEHHRGFNALTLTFKLNIL